MGPLILFQQQLFWQEEVGLRSFYPIILIKVLFHSSKRVQMLLDLPNSSLEKLCINKWNLIK